jgi:hypothetical protein
MKTFLAMILIAGSVVAQDTTKDKPGAAHDMGSGAANIGEGAGKAAGSAAKGTVKGAADLATLHPVGAATAIGGGAASAGKDVAVGSAKGVGKITRGVGKLFKKVL